VPDLRVFAKPIASLRSEYSQQGQRES
jgi:hypothetical protein